MAVDADWRDVLKARVQEVWDREQRALMLSRVPQVLKDAGIDAGELLQGRKLRPFLEAEGAGHFNLIQSERNHIVWGILPSAVAASRPYDQYLLRPEAERALRFAHAAWVAFTTPIEPGRRRWITDEPSVHFQDLAEDAEPGAGYHIDRRYIAEGDARGEVGGAVVVARIGEWAAEQKVDPSRFALGRRKSPVPRGDRAQPVGESALDQLLGILLPSELTRMSIPLDVVARLRSTKPRGEG